MSAFVGGPGRMVCQPCKDRGMMRAAFRVVTGTPMCGGCFAGHPPPPPSVETPRPVVLPKPFLANRIPPPRAMKEKSVSRRKNIDWPAVQRDRDAGIPVAQLVTKYGVSNPVIYKKTTGNGKPRAGGTSPVSGRDFAKRSGPAKTVGNSDGGSLIEKVRAELAHHEHMAKQMRTVIELLEEA